MAQKKLAFMVMGSDYQPEHRACFSVGGMDTLIVTVNTFEAARAAVLELHRQGVGVLELCGAFGPERAREYIELTNGELAVGYVVHFSEQDALFSSFFGG